MADDFLENDNSITTMRGFNEQWIPYILNYEMPNVQEADKAKKDIIQMLTPVMNTAARSNLNRTDVRLALWEFDNIWTAYFVYRRRGKYDSDLLMLKRSLKAGFNLMLRRSLEMGQMRMIFEPKQNIFQKLVSGSERKLKFFKNKNDENQQMEMD